MIFLVLMISQSIIAEEQDFNFIRNLFSEHSYSLVITEVKNFNERYPESNYQDDLYYFEAESYFRLQDYNEAIRLFSRYLKFSLKPDFKDDAHLRVIQAHFALGNDKEVIRWAGRFPQNSPLILEGWYLQGESQYRLGLFKDAKRSYEWVLKSGAKEELRVKGLYSLAYTHFRLKSFDWTISYCDQLTNEFPDHDLSREACFLKARALLKLGRKDQALDYLEFISEQNEDIAAEAKIMAGDICLESADYGRAQTFYGRVIRYYPLHPAKERAYLGLGRTNLHQGHYSEAMRNFKAFIDSFPESPFMTTAEHELGLAYLGAKNYHLARRLLKKTKDYYHIGLSYFEEGSYENAIDYFLKSKPNRKVDRLIGEAYYRLGDYESGIDYFLKVEARLDVARGYLLLNRVDDALRSLEGVEDYDGLLYRADIRYETDDYEGALADYLKAYGLENRPEPVYGAGWASFKLGDYESAIEYLSLLTKKYSGWKMIDDVYLTIGDCYLNLKDYQGAVKNYKMVSEDSGEYEVATFRIGIAHLRDHDYANAIRYFSQLKDDDAIYMDGYCRFQINDYQEAIKILSQISLKSRYYPSAQQTIGDCYYNLGEDNQALAVYLRIYSTQDSVAIVSSALDGIGWIYERRGVSDHFIEILDSLIGVEQRSWLIPELRLRIGERLIEKDHLRAFSQLNLAIKDATSDSLKGKALLLLTNGLFKIGNVDSAIKMSQVLATVDGYRDQGSRLTVKGFYLKRDYEKVLRVCQGMEESAERFYYSGLANRNLGRFNLAVQHFEHAIKIGRQGEIVGAAYLELAELKMAQGERDSALRLLRNSITNARDSVAAHAQIMLGEVYYQSGDYKTAIVEYRRLEYLFPTRDDLIGQSLIKIGECYEKLKDLNSARRSYLYLKKKYPNTIWEKKADEQLVRIGH